MLVRVANKNWGHKGTSVALIREAEAREKAKKAKAPSAPPP